MATAPQPLPPPPYEPPTYSFSPTSLVCYPDFPNEDSLVHYIGSTEIDDISENFAQGRMRIKLLGAKEALEAGVQRVVIGDARGENPILRALDGQGTVIS